MSVPTVMRWDHKNSPKITNMRNWTQLKAWYTAIFVDGYLADDDITLIPPLGWDVIFDDGNQRVTLHQDTGADLQLVNRMYIVLYYANCMGTDTATNNYGAYCGVYNNQGGVLLTTYGNNSTVYGLPIFYGNTNSGTNRICPYVVIGNNRGVYFFGGYNPSTSAPTIPNFSNTDDYSTWQYFGDFVNDGIDYGKNNQTCSYGYTSTSNNTSHNYRNYLNGSSDWAWVAGHNRIMYSDHNNKYMGMHITHDETGVTRGTNFTATPFGFGTGGVYVGKTPLYDLPYPYVDGSLKIVPFDLWIRNNAETPVNNKTDQVYIGKMPGLYFPMHYGPLATDNNLVEFEGSGEYEGKHFIGLARITYDEIYINITDDWGI